MKENDVAKEIIDAAFHIHKELGPGLLESVYEAVLARALSDRGLHVTRQKAIPLRYRDMQFDEGFRADLIVENLVIVEIKSVERTVDVFKKQLRTYLRLADMRLGLLLNFGTALFKEGASRVVNGLERDTPTTEPVCSS